MHAVNDEQLMAWLDGELNSENAVLTAGHVERCPECQALIAELGVVSDRLAAWQVESIPPDMPRAISSALRTRAPLKSRIHPLVWFAAVFATACFALVFLAQPKFQRFQEFAALRAPNEVAPKSEAMIVRTAQLTLTTTSLDHARAALDDIVKRHGGYFGELSAEAPSGMPRSLNASVRVPAGQLDATLAEARRLGRVESESQNGEDVSRQYVDLEARLANKRNAEQRLTALLRDRTGKLADVLAVEEQIDAVRGEIEQMEAQRKSMQSRVDFATLAIAITEARQDRSSLSGRIVLAAEEGGRRTAESIEAVLRLIASWGPLLLLWGALLFFPARALWRRLRYAGRGG